MTQDNPKAHDEIAQKLKDTAGVQAALKQAARDAVQEHARAGQKIVVWRDNQVVWEDPNGDGGEVQSAKGAEAQSDA